MNKTIEDLMSRRSIRRYRSEPVPGALLETVLRAGTCAPSGMNRQSPIIVAVRRREDIERMSRLNAEIMGTDSDPFFGAPVVLVVLADAKSPHAVQDGSLVMGNLMNAAHALGLGSCWVNRARELFDMPEGKALLEKWGVEGEYIGVGNCIVGWPDEAPAMKPRKEKYIYYID